MHSALIGLESFLAWLVRASWQAAVLACLVLAAQAVFGKRLSPAWRYGLWMLVVARLLLPATVESRASVFNLAPAPAVQRIAASVVTPDEPVETVVRSAGVRAPTVSEPAGKAAVAPARVPPIAPPRIRVAAGVRKISLRGALSAVWLGVVALLLARVMAKNFSFSSRVVRRRPVTNQDALDLLQDCKQEMGVHVPIDVLETPKVESPSLLGFLRPRILLPPGMLESFPRGKLRYFFLHELAHLRRGDILVNWLMTVLQILHWFNPFVWLAFSRMRAEREAACDAYVVAACGGERESRNYGDAVVDLLAFSARVHWLPGVAGILEDKKEMKRRIAMIATFKKYPRWTSVLAMALLAVLGIATLTDAQPATDSKSRVPGQAAEPSRSGGIEVSGQLVVIDSEAVAAIESKLDMDLDPATGRNLLSPSEATALLDALLVEKGARLVGEGSTVVNSGVCSPIKSTQTLRYKTDKDYSREVGWLMSVIPIANDEGVVRILVTPEWCDLLGMRSADNRKVPVFQSLNYTMSYTVPSGSCLLLHGSRAALSEFRDVEYASTVSAATRDRAQDFFLLLSARIVGDRGGGNAPPPQPFAVCRFLDLGPQAQAALRQSVGARALGGSELLSAEDYRRLLVALRNSPDAKTLALSPLAAESGVFVRNEWVQEVLYETAKTFETGKCGTVFDAIPVVDPEGRRMNLTFSATLAYPPPQELPMGGFSPVSISQSRSTTLEAGQTLLSSVSAGGGILPPGHRCFMAVTARFIDSGEPARSGAARGISRRVYTVPGVIAEQLESLDGDMAVQEWFQNRGVEFPDGSSISYSESDRRLTLLNTLPNLNRIGSVMEQMTKEHGKPEDAWAKKAIYRMMLDVPPSLAGKLRPGDVTAHFTKYRVPFPKGASVHYDSASGMIVVSNTTANLEKLRDLLAAEED